MATDGEGRGGDSAPGRGDDRGPMVLTRAGVLAGARQLAPLAFTTVIAFGLAFGLAARQAGLSLVETGLWSALAFAGASQFAVLGLWTMPVPLVPALLMTLAVNARHLLMGAVMRPWLARLPARKVYPMVALMADANWAYTVREFRAGGRDAGHLLGGGLILWACWVPGTLAGHLLGAGLTDPARWGLDAVMPAFFAVVLVGMWRGRADALPWAAAAGAALVAGWWLPAQWHVLVGGIVGGLVGALRHGD